MDSSYIITFIGNDRPGLVEQLSRVIETQRGNWLESRLSQLGGKFAGLVLVSLPAENVGALEREMKTLSDAGLSIRLTAAELESGAPRNARREITLSVMGPDRLGIVREVSRALAERMINVVDMDSGVDSAAMSGEMLFRARIDAQIPVDLDLDDLSDSLDDIAEQMTLEIDIDRGI